MSIGAAGGGAGGAETRSSTKFNLAGVAVRGECKHEYALTYDTYVLARANLLFGLLSSWSSGVDYDDNNDDASSTLARTCAFYFRRRP